MGLDMYLNKRTYIGNKYRDKDKMVIVRVPKNQEGVMFKTSAIKNERVSEITENVGYWRKANAIHNWFVKNVQDGEDDCESYYVSEKDIKKLLADVNRVLEASKLVSGKIKNGQHLGENGWEDVMEDGQYIEDPTIAQEVLPTTEGFFFGGSDYDQYYIENLKETKKIMEQCLAEGGEYYYQSSW